MQVAAVLDQIIGINQGQSFLIVLVLEIDTAFLS